VSKKIMALGMNPAWQKSLFFKELAFHEVNRVEEAHAMASGKGINFVRAARTWGRADAFVLQPVGGYTGALIRKALEDEKLPEVSIQTSAPTRICSTLICGKTKTATEIIEPSGELSPAEISHLKERIEHLLKEADALALCGTYPPGITAEFYAWAARSARQLGKPVILDAYKGIMPTLEAGIDFLKINREELFALTGCADILDSLQYVHKKYKLKALAVTAGPDTAFLTDADGTRMYSVPLLENLINPIGAGDTCTAVMFSEILRGVPYEESFAWGLAAASASCETPYAAVFSSREAGKLFKTIRIEMIC